MYLGITPHQWKSAMASYAHEKHVQIPVGFNPVTQHCAQACHELLKRVQHHAGMAQDGVIGPQTAELLRHWFPGDERHARARVCQVAQHGVDIAATILYDQLRPMTFTPWPRRMDCSWYATFCPYWAHVADPNGLHYSGAGNTETLYHHLGQRKLGEQEPGDLIIFGGAVLNRLSHVVICAEGGTDPNVYSMGSDNGPLKLRLSAEAPYHAGLPMTVHRLI